MSEFDTAPAAPEFERHVFDSPAAFVAKALDEAQESVSAVLRAEALLPPGYRIVYDTTPLGTEAARDPFDPDRDWRHRAWECR